MNEKVYVREVGPRDGLQMVSSILDTDKKLQWCRRGFEAGLREIEVTSFVPAKVVPQFYDARQVALGAMDIEGLEVAALVPNLRGAQDAFELGVPKINYTLSASETHNLKNVRRTVDESIDGFRQIQALRASLGLSDQNTLACGISAAFGCTLEGDIKPSQVLRIVESLLKLGVDELAIADTVGMGNPVQVKSLFKDVMREAGDVPVAAHFHDTRGLGLANVLAALDAGVRLFDSSLAGLGGCPFAPNATGNINTEDLVFMLESMGLDTGIDLPALLALRGDLAQWLPNEKLSGSISKAGLPINFKSVSHS